MSGQGQEQGKGKKLVFVGDSGVGKTCIIARFLKGVFEENAPSTGASFATKTIEVPGSKEGFTFDIWDTAGQERYRSLTKFFFQGAKIAILVYDITRKETFDNLKNEWYKQIKEHGDEDVILGIAGNKSDLYDEEAVSEQEARDFAKSIGAVFSLTSAQNNSGIEDFFRNLARRYLGIDTTTDATGGNKPKPKQEQKPGNDNTIKIDSKNATKKKDEKKKGFC
jgi:small GTP-binding protein